MILRVHYTHTYTHTHTQTPSHSEGIVTADFCSSSLAIQDQLCYSILQQANRPLPDLFQITNLMHNFFIL